MVLHWTRLFSCYIAFAHSLLFWSLDVLSFHCFVFRCFVGFPVFIFNGPFRKMIDF